MAVYTHYSFNALAKIIDQHWRLKLLDFKPVEAGIENSIYAISTVENKDKQDDQANIKPYACIAYENLSVEAVETYCKVLSFIQEKAGFDQDFQVTQALPLQRQHESGLEYTCIDQKPLVLQAWIAGQPESPTIDLCQQLGQRLQAVHGVDLPARFGLPINEHLSRIHLLEKEVDGLSAEDQSFFHKTWQGFQPLVELHPEFEQSIVHGDLFPDNVLVVDGKLSGFIDFFAASRAPKMVDIAIACIAWCTSDQGDFLLDYMQAFLSGYSDVQSLPDLDRQHFLDFLELLIFRFWCSRQTYQLKCQAMGIEAAAHRHPAFCRQLLRSLERQRQAISQIL